MLERRRQQDRAMIGVGTYQVLNPSSWEMMISGRIAPCTIEPLFNIGHPGPLVRPSETATQKPNVN